MPVVNVQEAKTRLSELLARAERGEEVVIARSGTPVARLVPVGGPPPRRFGGVELHVPDDFDAPLPDDELSAWE
jgi:prevent-host-death family protein